MKFITALFLATMAYFSHSFNEIIPTKSHSYQLTGLDTVEIRQYFACPGDTIRIRDTFFVASTVYLTAEEGTDSIKHQVNFSDFQFFLTQDTIMTCAGDTLELVYGTDIYSSFADGPDGSNNEPIPLPDGTGATYQTSINVPIFSDQNTLNSIEQIRQICVNMEHSWMWDLDIKLFCPNGDSIFLQKQDFVTREILLGEPYELDDAFSPFPPTPGTGYTYCWTPAAEETWASFTESLPQFNRTLPAGEYLPHESFEGLLGCPLSGEWKLEITDLWASDNGWIFFWSIDFTNPERDQINQIVQQGWSDGQNIIAVNDTVLLALPEVGITSYNYFVEDDFGCRFDTSILINVLPTDRTRIDTTLCFGESVDGILFEESGIYEFSQPNPNGCENITVYEVEIIKNDTTVIIIDSCGFNQLDSTLTVYNGINGCDSVVLEIIQATANGPHTILDFVACPGDTIFTQDTFFVEEATYVRTFPTNSVCDSIVEIHAIFKDYSDLIESSYEQVVCENDTVRIAYNPLLTLSSQDWTSSSLILSFDETELLAQPGVGVHTFTHSIVDLDNCQLEQIYTVEVLASANNTPITIDTIICAGAVLGDFTVFESGIYQVSLNSERVCDSLVSYNANVLPADTTFIDEATCIQVEAGITIKEYTNRFGCDSIVITDLYFAPDTMYFNTTTCVEQDTGTFTTTYFDQNGCQFDEIVTREFVPVNYEVLVTPDTCNRSVGGAQIDIEDDSQTYYFTGLSNFNDTIGIYNNLQAGTYNVTISAANGNCGFAIDVEVPNFVFEEPFVRFNAFVQEDDFTVAFENESEGADFYFWNFGDSSFSNEASPSHTYQLEGDYEVCLTASNDCTSSTACQTIRIRYSQELVKLKIGTEVGFNGTSVAVPVTAENFQNVFGVFTDIVVADPLFSFDSLEPIKLGREGFFTTRINPTRIQFNWENPGGSGLSLESTDTLLLVHITLSGLFGRTSAIIGENLVVQRSQNGSPVEVRATIESGHVSISQPVEFIAGSVLLSPYHDLAESGINNVEINLSGANRSWIDYTDQDGQYQLDSLHFSFGYTLSLKKEGNALNGLSTRGQIRILQHVFGTNLLTSPYAIIAADATCDEVVDTNDVAAVQQILMGEMEIFETCPNWTFLPKNYQFGNPGNPFPYPQVIEIMELAESLTNQDFYGIKTGDVFGNADPQLRFPENDAGDTLYLRANNKQLNAGEEVVIEFRFDGFEELLGYQFSLNYDQAFLEYLDFEMGDIPEQRSDNFGLAGIAFGEFRSNWFNRQAQPTTLPVDGTTAVEIRFRAKQAVSDLGPLFTVGQSELKAEAYDENLEILPIVLQFDAITNTNALEPTGFNLYQSQPNPFNKATLIQFELPERMKAQLIIHNQLGAEVVHYAGSYEEGINQILVEDEVLKAEGIYYYTLIARNYKQTRKMVKIK